MNKKIEEPKLQKGIIQVYFGNGKGKTTAAIGQAVRALGQGLRVYMAQFLKPMNVFSGEMAIFETFGTDFIFRRPNTTGFLEKTPDSNEKEKEKGLIIEEMISARDMISTGVCDIFIFDELLTALNLGLIEEFHLTDLMKAKTEFIEMIFTGLKSTQNITDLADLVTEMRLVKHPFQTGLKARKGIEY